jgi:predicted  nucleic acid-binding Zn-ribbon protein
MDATHIPNHLTDLDQQIAEVEARMASAKTRKERAALAAEHEQLLRRVQWATVGAAKPGEVL